MTDCDIVVDYIKKKEGRFDLQDVFYRYTLEGIGQIAFGVSLGVSRPLSLFIFFLPQKMLCFICRRDASRPALPAPQSPRPTSNVGCFEDGDAIFQKHFDRAQQIVMLRLFDPLW